MISSQHRSAMPRLRQIEVVMNDEKRKVAANILFRRRKKLIEKYKEFGLPPFLEGESYDTIQKMMAVEGAWAKRAYRKIAQDFKIPWQSKKVEDESGNSPIIFLNFLSYSIADIAIYHLGYDPNIGVLHGRTKGGGLSYDLADVFKPILALVPSFIAQQRMMNLKQMKNEFISDVVRFEILDYLIKTLEMMFPKNEIEKGDE